MTRPLYETASDRECEQAVADYLGRQWEKKFTKMHLKYYVDYMIFSNGPATATAEIKRRHNPSAQYPTLILSLAKWNRGIEYFNTNDLAFFLIPVWDDGVFIFKYRDDTPAFKVEMGGRKDRNDPEDIEPVIHIPVELFRKVADNEEVFKMA